MSKVERYELRRPMSELAVEGEGGLRHLRLFVNAKFVQALRADDEEMADYYMTLGKQVTAEIKSRG